MLQEMETNEKPRNLAEQFVKLEFPKVQTEVFQNESKSEIDFIVKSKSGNYHEISLQPLNLDEERTIKIPKTELGFELKENLWIVMVLFMKEMEPAILFNSFQSI